jgi:hypothetical protein
MTVARADATHRSVKALKVSTISMRVFILLSREGTGVSPNSSKAFSISFLADRRPNFMV